MALGIAFVGFGFRSDLTTTPALVFLAAKLAFAIGIAGLALVYLTRLARLGGERKSSSFSSLYHFLWFCFLRQSASALRPARIGGRMIVGDEWRECLLSIPIIAIVPFAASIWAVRKGAPTNLCMRVLSPVSSRKA